MLRSQKRLLALLGAVPILLVLSAVLYMAGMTYLEGDPRGFWHSLAWAAETLSTTGYGHDGTWNHPAMVLFVVVLQFLGVFLIFLIFPIYLIPFLEERFEARLPTHVKSMSDHLIVYRHGPAVSGLLEQAERAGLATLVVEPDEDEARRLVERGARVLHSRLEDGGLEKAHLLRAHALIANSSDDEDAAVILAARSAGYQGEVLALVEEPFHRKPMMLAGATACYTPRHVLGAALAAKASGRVAQTVAGVHQLGRNLEIAEIRVRRDSSLAGRTLGELGVGQLTGVTVIGMWVGGRLDAELTAATRLEPDGILIAAGSAESLARFAETCGAAQLRSEGPYLVCGLGEVGRKVVQLLRDAGEPVTVIELQDLPGVDVCGDVLDPRVLEQARVSEARAAILALNSDSGTLFGTVILKDLAPDVPVIARVNRPENVERIHRAGADFVLSLSQVSGQLLARRLLGEEAISVDARLRVVKTAVDGLAGRHPSELEIRQRTGCSVIGVERGEDLILEFRPDFRFGDGDAVYICGSDEATRRYAEVFPAS